MRRLPPLNGLRAFEATARHMSFSKAAEELNVTPAALSHQVRGLEDILSIKLFNRLNRAIELTEAGRLLYPGLEDGFDRIADAVSRLQRIADDKVLVIACGPAFAAKWLAPRLYRFLEREPELDVRISAGLGFVEVGPQGCDIAIRFGDGHYPGLHVERLVEERLVPLCSPETRDMAPGLNGPEDLVRAGLIHDDSLSFSKSAQRWSDWLTEAGVSSKVDGSRGARFSHADHAIDAAAEGGGVVLARKVLAAGELRHGRLVAPFDLELPTGLYFHFVCARGTENLPKIASFHAWLMDEMEGFSAALPTLGRTPPASRGELYGVKRFS